MTLLGDLVTRYIAQCRADGELAPKSVDTYEATIDAVKSRLWGYESVRRRPGSSTRF